MCVKPDRKLFLYLSVHCVAALLISHQAFAQELTINQLQFIGSHNSYKQLMSKPYFDALLKRNEQAARSLEYQHPPIPDQLDLGVRKLEIDLFNTEDFVVGHVQTIDMNSNCSPLSQCFKQILSWSDANPHHAPIWISFNAKDSPIPDLPTPLPFREADFDRLDRQIMRFFNDRIIAPKAVKTPGRAQPDWPKLKNSRGKFLFILDEAGDKRATYVERWRERPMFTTVEPDHEATAILVINDPVRDGSRIQALVRSGYMVRTRADADTVEARQSDTSRRDAALASGAQAVSTDYYLPAHHLDSDYIVRIEGAIRCNPVNSSPESCATIMP